MVVWRWKWVVLQAQRQRGPRVVVGQDEQPTKKEEVEGANGTWQEKKKRRERQKKGNERKE